MDQHISSTAVVGQYINNSTVVSQQSAASQSSSNTLAAPTSAPPPLLTGTLPTSTPAPQQSSTRPAAFTISPMKLRVTQGTPREETTRGRKRGKSMIATLSPEIMRMREELEAKKAK
ncbi:hypothetical protein PoB_000852800 [Plakobranchus ocellatus]|uniref:Uncharacterized protein n=1 Tax=Plakobranchus ocellatus TaxID=259542 RepID=A0AAV3YHM6_9GAST|nr:hypothetical protein PoB_000852800 [Plakobranchus ocellatus]